MKSLYLIIIVCLTGYQTNAQSGSQLSLEECYTLARHNYPLVRQAELVSKATEYSIENAAKAYLPQFSISGQASYQSDVTKVPVHLPGMSIPELSKDQYRLSAEGSQILFDGGLIGNQKEAIVINSEIENEKLEVELYKLKDRINQLFFGILFINEQMKQNELLKKDLQMGIDKAKATVANGTALKSSLNVLIVEQLKVKQKTAELKFTRKGYLDVLSLFIHRQLPADVTLIKPLPPAIQQEVRRPELELFRKQLKSLDVKEKSVSARNLPKFSLFLQGGVGKPALNMLNNSAEPFAAGGLKMSWPLSGFYTSKKEKAIITVNRKEIDLQKENFLMNTDFTVKQQDAEIGKQIELLASDDEIVALRAGIKETSVAQLQNGVINTSDYLREVNAEDQARLNKILHEIQLLMAQYNKKTTIGY